MEINVLTSTLEFVMISIAVAVAVILLIIFLVYLLGNVYNGLVRRREKVKTSSRELWKLLSKYYDVLLTFIKQSASSNEKDELITLIHSLTNSNREDITLQGELFFQIRDLVEIIKQNDTSTKESADFLNEYDRLIKFSIPLYNANVKDYNHFLHLFFNRAIARIFHFNEAYYFRSKEEASLDDTNKTKRRDQ